MTQAATAPSPSQLERATENFWQEVISSLDSDVTSELRSEAFLDVESFTYRRAFWWRNVRVWTCNDEAVLDMLLWGYDHKSMITWIRQELRSRTVAPDLANETPRPWLRTPPTVLQARLLRNYVDCVLNRGEPRSALRMSWQEHTAAWNEGWLRIWNRLSNQLRCGGLYEVVPGEEIQSLVWIDMPDRVVSRTCSSRTLVVGLRDATAPDGGKLAALAATDNALAHYKHLYSILEQLVVERQEAGLGRIRVYLAPHVLLGIGGVDSTEWVTRYGLLVWDEDKQKTIEIVI